MTPSQSSRRSCTTSRRSEKWILMNWTNWWPKTPNASSKSKSISLKNKARTSPTRLSGWWNCKLLQVKRSTKMTRLLILAMVVVWHLIWTWILSWFGRRWLMFWKSHHCLHLLLMTKRRSKLRSSRTAQHSRELALLSLTAKSSKSNGKTGWVTNTSGTPSRRSATKPNSNPGLCALILTLRPKLPRRTRKWNSIRSCKSTSEKISWSIIEQDHWVT